MGGIKNRDAKRTANKVFRCGQHPLERVGPLPPPAPLAAMSINAPFRQVYSHPD